MDIGGTGGRRSNPGARSNRGRSLTGGERSNRDPGLTGDDRFSRGQHNEVEPARRRTNCGIVELRVN